VSLSFSLVIEKRPRIDFDCPAWRYVGHGSCDAVCRDLADDVEWWEGWEDYAAGPPWDPEVT
jgi:hypothetical protein